ncbi:hypothetical protein Tco_1139392 [Tanacetum coccineum]
MGKRKPDKNSCITVNLFHGGVLTVPPFEYAHSDEKQITDVHFEGMSFVQFRKVIRNLVQDPVASLYYCKVDTALRIGIKPLKNDSDVDQFVIFAYQNKWEVNLYVEHNGYDALDIRDQGETIADDEDNESSDAYCSSDDEDLCYVDFHTEVDDNVVIKTLSINDPFLSKLCSNSGQFSNFIDEPVNANIPAIHRRCHTTVVTLSASSSSPPPYHLRCHLPAAATPLPPPPPSRHHRYVHLTTILSSSPLQPPQRTPLSPHHHFVTLHLRNTTSSPHPDATPPPRPSSPRYHHSLITTSPQPPPPKSTATPSPPKRVRLDLGFCTIRVRLGCSTTRVRLVLKTNPTRVRLAV